MSPWVPHSRTLTLKVARTCRLLNPQSWIGPFRGVGQKTPTSGELSVFGNSFLAPETIAISDTDSPGRNTAVCRSSPKEVGAGMSSMRVHFRELTCFLLALLTIAIAPRTADSQAPASVSAETVRSEIRRYAVRHARTDSGMKTEVILDLFRNNRAGLPPTEVAQVYETEYSKEREARKPGPWDVLRPNAGWFISCILLLWLVFRKSLEEWLKAVVDAIGEGFRRRFAGSRLFRGMALRCYQRDLIQKYALLQIPFSGKKLEMRKIFVPLKVMGATGADHVDAYRAMKESTRLMIVGPPGSGKSMLL